MKHAFASRFGEAMMLGFSLAAAVATTSCVSPDANTLIVGSPYERYDHNRTQKLVTAPTQAGTNIDRVEIYSPFGSALFPRAQLAGAESSDSLPGANVVPVFTGVPLPLSTAAVASEISDRDDLLNFLARPLHAGVKRPRGAIDLKGVADAYRPLLEFLESKDDLSGTWQQVIARLRSRRILEFRQRDIARRIRDPRYDLDNSFTEVLAFRVRPFWFVLYRVRGYSHFSRLVVVPEAISGPGLRADPNLRTNPMN